MKKIILALAFLGSSLANESDILMLVYTMNKNNQAEALRLGKYYPKSQKDKMNIMTKCHDGDLVYCNNLGYLYTNSIGFAKDTNKALQIFTKACENNLAISCYNLAQMTNNNNKRQEYLKKACKLGDKYSCDLLSE